MANHIKPILIEEITEALFVFPPLLQIDMGGQLRYYSAAILDEKLNSVVQKQFVHPRGLMFCSVSGAEFVEWSGVLQIPTQITKRLCFNLMRVISKPD